MPKSTNALAVLDSATLIVKISLATGQGFDHEENFHFTITTLFCMFSTLGELSLMDMIVYENCNILQRCEGCVPFLFFSSGIPQSHPQNIFGVFLKLSSIDN